MNEKKKRKNEQKTRKNEVFGFLVGWLGVFGIRFGKITSARAEMTQDTRASC